MRVAALALAVLACTAARAEDVGTRIAELQTQRLRPLDFAAFEAALAALTLPPDAEDFLRSAGIADLQTAMAAKELTAEAITLWHLGRIRRLDDGLRGMLELNPAALDEARAADARRAAGKTLGPLDGIPATLKDNIGTAPPLHTTANAEVLLDNQPLEDAALVASLRAAGAVIIGKASLSEFAGAVSMGYPSGGSGAVGGQGVNPLGPYPTYGSSSGSAISVAANYATASIGTETSGSLVAPSAVMSLVGMKPSAGLVSTAGVVPLVSANDGPGPIARSVTDAALLLAAIDTADVDYAAALSPDALTGVKVGVLVDDLAGAGNLSGAITRTGATLALLGAATVPVSLKDPTGTDDLFIAYLSAGMRTDMMPYISALHPDLVTLEDLITYNRADPARRMPFGQDLLAMIAPLSASLSPEDRAELDAAMQKAMTGAIETAFASQGGVKVLVGMANLQSPFYATAGYPAITVPIGRRDDGEPVGVTLIGRKGDDARLLAFAYAFEQATQARVVPDLP